MSAIRWKESSKIVTLYSEDGGLIKLIAHGAFRKNNPFAGKLEALSLLRVDYVQKNSRSMQILVESELLDSFQEIRLDLTRLSHALSMLELIQQTFEDGDPDPVFFKFLLELLNSFSVSKYPANMLIYFLLKLASYLGFKPELQHCVGGNLTTCGNPVYLSLRDGHISCDKCQKISGADLHFSKDEYFFLKYLQSSNYRRLKYVERTHQNSMRIITRLVRFINYHFESELKLESLSYIL